MSWVDFLVLGTGLAVVCSTVIRVGSSSEPKDAGIILAGMYAGAGITYSVYTLFCPQAQPRL